MKKTKYTKLNYNKDMESKYFHKSTEEIIKEAHDRTKNLGSIVNHYLNQNEKKEPILASELLESVTTTELEPQDESLILELNCIINRYINIGENILCDLLENISNKEISKELEKNLGYYVKKITSHFEQRIIPILIKTKRLTTDDLKIIRNANLDSIQLICDLTSNFIEHIQLFSKSDLANFSEWTSEDNVKSMEEALNLIEDIGLLYLNKMKGND